jgi:hypothetical protein
MFVLFDVVYGLVLVGILLTVVSIPFVLWGAIDAGQRPGWVWFQAAQNRGLWIGLMVGGLLLYGPLGGAAAIFYLASIRPRLIAAEQAGPPPFPYGVRAADLPPPARPAPPY